MRVPPPHLAPPVRRSSAWARRRASRASSARRCVASPLRPASPLARCRSCAPPPRLLRLLSLASFDALCLRSAKTDARRCAASRRPRASRVAARHGLRSPFGVIVGYVCRMLGAGCCCKLYAALSRSPPLACRGGHGGCVHALVWRTTRRRQARDSLALAGLPSLWAGGRCSESKNIR